jgi:predicted RNase H-like nuclease (RuvC/YqgF family)
MLKSQDETIGDLQKLNHELELMVKHMDAENKMLKSEFSEFRHTYAALDDRVEYLETITAKIGKPKKELHKYFSHIEASEARLTLGSTFMKDVVFFNMFFFLKGHAPAMTSSFWG